MTATEIIEFRTMLARLMHIGQNFGSTYSVGDLMSHQVAIEKFLGEKIGKPLDGEQLREFRVLTGTLMKILGDIAMNDKTKHDLLDHQGIIESWVDQQTGKQVTSLVAPFVKMGVLRNGIKVKKLK